MVGRSELDLPHLGHEGWRHQEVVEDELPARTDTVEDVPHRMALVVGCRQVADAVIWEGDEPGRFFEIEISKIGLDQRQAVEYAGFLSTLAAALEHCGRAVNADDRASSPRGLDGDATVPNTQLDDGAVGRQIRVDIER